MTTTDLPVYDDVVAAAARLKGMAVHTPVIRSEALDARTGRAVFLKLESLQRTGTFKFRGAYNRMVQMNAAERAAGVIAFSSGNHAQGVAHAAQILGIKAAIVMPTDAPQVKISGTKAYGAEVILYDRYSESREAIAARLAQERGAIVVPSFDDRDIIAGQGTVGHEMMAYFVANDISIDAILTCCGGGGLTAGSALAIKHHSPATRIFTTEPADFDDTARSFVSGERERNSDASRSICDALLSKMPGEMTFAMNREMVESGISVTDDEVARAVSYAYRVLKIVLEPGGAVTLAAALAGKLPDDAATIGLICSGGNVDDQVFADCLAQHPLP